MNEWMNLNRPIALSVLPAGRVQAVYFYKENDGSILIVRQPIVALAMAYNGEPYDNTLPHTSYDVLAVVAEETYLTFVQDGSGPHPDRSLLGYEVDGSNPMDWEAEARLRLESAEAQER